MTKEHKSNRLSVVRQFADEEFLQLGFKRRKNYWVRELEEVVQFGRTLRSMYGSAYFVEVAVSLPETVEHYGKLDIALADVETRVEQLAPNGAEFVEACYECRPMELSTRREIFARWFAQHVGPFFEDYCTRESLLALARKPQSERGPYEPTIHPSLRFAVETPPPGVSRFLQLEPRTPHRKGH